MFLTRARLAVTEVAVSLTGQPRRPRRPGEVQHGAFMTRLRGMHHDAVRIALSRGLHVLDQALRDAVAAGRHDDVMDAPRCDDRNIATDPFSLG